MYDCVKTKKLFVNLDIRQTMNEKLHTSPQDKTQKKGDKIKSYKKRGWNRRKFFGMNPVRATEFRH